LKKIGIINCYEVSKKCSGNGCINAFNNKSGSFDKYAYQDAEIAGFIQCPGCSENVIQNLIEESEKLKAEGVEAIHLSTCIRAKCQWFKDFFDVLSNKFEVADYTHGKKR
jgi:predicted metal-binding protein